jgi:hypothetical protein
MDVQLIKRSAIALFVSILLPATAMSQLQLGQVLDTVQGFNETTLREVNFDDPSGPFDITTKTNANFTACSLSAGTGTWCLHDGLDVINITNLDPNDPNLPDPVFSCDDDALPFNANSKKGPPCLSLAANALGDLYLAGPGKGPAYTVAKLVRADSNNMCDGAGGFENLQSAPDWCFKTLAEGRPLIDHMFALFGQAAEDFMPDCDACMAAGSANGVVVLEQRKAVAAILDDSSVEFIAESKRAWDLGKEELQSIALLQTTDDVDVYNYILATSTADVIRAVNVAGEPMGRIVFDVATDRAARNPAVCDTNEQRLGITTSIDGVVFMTDRNFCNTLALQADDPGSGFMLQRVDDLSTAPTALNGPMTIQGIVVDLALCGVGQFCELEFGPGGEPAAILSNAQTIGPDTTLILFHLTDAAECRAEAVWQECLEILEENRGLDPGTLENADLFKPGGFIDDPTGVDGNGIGNTPAAWRLNVRHFVEAKPEITELLTDPLPDMWLERWYRGKEVRGDPDPVPPSEPDPENPLDNHFDGYFAVSKARMINAAELKLLIEELTGDELGCPLVPPGFGTPVSEIRDTNDVVAKVSENFISINGTHLAMQQNYKCGSTFAKIGRWSFIGLDLQFIKDSFDEVSETVTFDDEAFFLAYVETLVKNLGLAIDQLACQKVDGQGPSEQPPLLTDTCADLSGKAAVLLDKVEKCDDAARTGKVSLLDQTCQAARTHLANLLFDLDALPELGEGDDPANRVEELYIRGLVIDHVFETMTIPSFQDGPLN